MSLTKTINYDDPANFSFDGAVLEVTSRAALKDLGGGTYSTANPTMEESVFLQVDGLVSFSASTIVPGGTEIKYYLVVDGNAKYWNGSAWVTSDKSLAQTNTEADINTNISSLDVSSGVQLKVGALFRSATGTATPELSSVTLVYNFYAAVLTPAQCVVYGYVFDNTSVVNGATITFKSRDFIDESANFIHINTSTTTDANGYFEINLPSSVRTGEDDVKVDVTISFTDSNSKIARKSLTIVIPNSPSSSLEDAKVDP